jgi:hypothetical protein
MTQIPPSMRAPEFAPVLLPNGELRVTYLGTSVVLHPDEAGCLLIDVRPDTITPRPGAVFVRQQPVHDEMPPQEEWDQMAESKRDEAQQIAQTKQLLAEAKRNVSPDATEEEKLEALAVAAVQQGHGPPPHP